MILNLNTKESNLKAELELQIREVPVHQAYI